MWPRPAPVVMEPVLLGHRAGDVGTSGYVASTTLPHPRLDAVALFEGWGQLEDEAELGCLSGTSQDVLPEHCSVAEVIFE
jgi:hypothetical protein